MMIFKKASIAILLLLLPCSQILAKLSASLDREIIFEGESVTLRISTNNNISAKPDLAPLKKDFVITGNRTSKRSGIVNGQPFQTTRWSIQITPRKNGQFRIPPITVGNEQTPSFSLNVTELPKDIQKALAGHIYLEVEFNTDQPVYVQQQVPYTLRLYYDNTVRFGKLTGPEPDNAVVEQLGQEQQFTESRDGREFNVLEQRYVISAEKSGNIIIPPSTFSGRISIQLPDKNEPLDNENFETLQERGFSIPPSQRTLSHINRRVQISSKPVSINILAKDKTASDHWVPAELLQLVDSWTRSPPHMKIGEPAIRISAIQSKGLTGTQLPALDIKKPQSARVYTEPAEMLSKTDGHTVYGSSTQKITYIPDQAGLLTIPAIDINWWNIRTNQKQTAHLPEWEINVQGANSTSNHVASDAITTTDNSESGNTPFSGNSFKRDLLITAVIIISLPGLFWLWKKRNLTQQKNISKQPRLTTYEDLHQACSEHKPATTINQMLLEIARQEWPVDPPTTLQQLAGRTINSKQAILELDQQLYGQTNDHWDSQLLWEAVKDGLKPETQSTQDRDVALAPLYPYR